MILNYELCVLYILLSVSFVLGQYYSEECTPLQWKCKTNNQCISSDLRCDGKKDCKDGSDETVEFCGHIECPGYSFRCVYGACVEGTAECNGIQDCADNSDESSYSCTNATKEVLPNSNCNEEQFFSCKSGQCIRQDHKCDGKIDCNDGSDETVDVCAKVYCPAYSFRCGYGACINKNTVCDGKNDCIDNSDELLSLCVNYQTTQKTVAYEVNPPTPRRTTRPPITRPTPRSTTPLSSDYSCYIEPIDKLIYAYESDPTDEIKPRRGMYVDNFATVLYKCQKGYYLVGPASNSCRNGKWSSKLQPSCLKFCSKIDGVTFRASCHYNTVGVPCDESIRPNTTATISCRIGYRAPKGEVSNNVLLCGEEGEWDYPAKRCEPICGKSASNVIKFSAGGKTTQIEKVPWHAAIYERSEKGRIDHICGGSILNAKIIVTAAHCVWDDRLTKKIDHTVMRVAVGKFYRSFDAEEQHPAQYFNVSAIIVESGYLGVQNNYQNDLAILVLNNYIVFSSYIAPICLEWKEYSDQAVKSGEFGVTPGWGQDDSGHFSDELKTVVLKSRSFEECRKGFDQSRLGLIAGDKFCVSNRDGYGVCAGDSGGSYAILRDETTYFLWGVVSTGFAITTDENSKCTSSNISVYTNIQYHSKFITDIEPKYRPK